MLDSENAALVYDTIRERDDFISFADDNDEEDEDWNMMCNISRKQLIANISLLYHVNNLTQLATFSP